MKGEIRMEYTVWCACANWEYGGSTRRGAALLAKAKGWKLTRTDGWVCPGCQEKKETKLCPPS